MQGFLKPEEEREARAHAETCATCGPRLALAIAGAGSRGVQTRTVELATDPDRSRAVPAEAPLPRGTTVGRYVLLDCVGQGGMGFVYAAYDPELDRRVAVKLLRTGEGDDEVARSRLLREAQAMARLSHPNVVAAFDAGVHHGRVFVAMEYVHGITLKEWLVREPRSWREVVRVFAEAGQGLAAAHARHLVHRDFKPANVLVGDDGRVRVTDFGLARAELPQTPAPGDERAAAPAPAPVEPAGPHAPGSFSDPLTRVGSVLGTIGYMAPEQCLNKPLDARTDQFAWCICLWEALYGARPFTGDSAMAVTRAVIDARLPEPPRRGVPGRVHALLVRGLSKEPDARFPSMPALLDELQRDPLVRVRAAAPWAVAVLLLVAGAAGFSLSKVKAAGRCTGFESSLANAWDGSLKAKVKAAFDATNKSFAGAAWQSTERGLDAFAAGLVQARRDACEATWVKNAQSEEVLKLRDECFQRRRDELRALTAVLAEADAPTVERSVTAVYGLTPVAVCANTPALKASALLETLDEPEAQGLRETLARSKARLDSGQYAKALELLVPAVARARELKLPGLEAEALLLLGATQQATGKFADALASLEQTFAAALGAGLDEVAARAAVNAQMVVSYLERHGEARVWDQAAGALITRMGGDGRLEVERLRAQGIALATSGKPLEAAQVHERSLVRALALFGEGNPLLWKSYFDVGTSYCAAKEWSKAIPQLEKALDVKQAAQGPEHPDVALILSNLANPYFFTDQQALARATFERALTLREKLLGKDSPRLVALLNNYGDALAKAGDFEQARALLQRCRELGDKTLGPTHTFTMAAHLSLAELELSQGDQQAAKKELEWILGLVPRPADGFLSETLAVRAQLALDEGKVPDARRLAEEAVAVATRVGANSAELVLPLTAMGQVMLAQHQRAEAITPLERALQVADDTRAWSVYRADVAWALARALGAADEPRVTALVAHARAVYAASPVRVRQLAALEAWRR